MNKEFANLLAKAVESGKLNKSKLVNDFIDEFDGNPNGELPIITKDTKFTEEIRTLSVKVRKARLKIHDHLVAEIFNLAAESATETPKVESITSRFHAQEY